MGFTIREIFKMYKEEKNNIIICDDNNKPYITIRNYNNTYNGKPCVMIWIGNKKITPDYQYSFENEQRRIDFVDKTVKDKLYFQNKKIAENKAIKENLKNYKVQMKVGDILHYRFGYSMTLNEFYQVVDIKGKKVTLKELCTESKPTGWLQMEVRPIRDSFRDNKEITKILQVKQYSLEHKPYEYIVIDRYSNGHATVCDENEWYYENHAD